MRAGQSIASMVSMMNVSDTRVFCIDIMASIFINPTGKRHYNIKVWKLFNNVRSGTFLFVEKRFYYRSVLIVYLWLPSLTAESFVVMEVKLYFSRIRNLVISSSSEGLSPELTSLEQVRQIRRPIDVPNAGE